MASMKFPLHPRYTARYVELARLLIKYGRSDLVTDIAPNLMDEYSDPTAVAAETASSASQEHADQLAADLERMGPTFIKLGQLLSTRVDLLPPAYTDALARLQDEVEPFAFADVKRIVETELGVSIGHAFTSFDERPLAAASLAQVHRAELRSGRQVVVKVQRPGVREQVREDMAALSELADFVDAHTAIGRKFGLSDLLDQFRRSLAGELDYYREARNLGRIGELLADYPRLVVPAAIEDYSSGSVLTMDFVEGRKITDISPLGRLDIDGRALVSDLFAGYLKMILSDGLFHADPHPGNLLLTPDHRIALLDLGMVGTVSPHLQDRIVKLLLAISDGDGRAAADVLTLMGHPLPGFQEDAFKAAATELVTSAVNAGAAVRAGSVLVELSRLSGANALRPPSEMVLVGKALLNLDQVTAHLDPDFEPAVAVRENVATIMRARMHTSPAGLLAAALEAKEFTARLPGRINMVLDSLAEGSFTIKVDAIDEAQLLHVMQRLATRLTMGVVIAALVLGAALMMQIPTHTRILGYPAIAMVFFLLAAIAAASLIGSIVISDRRIARRSRANRQFTDV